MHLYTDGMPYDCRTSKIKDLKNAIVSHFGVDVASLKLLIKGSSNHPDTTRLCDIAGLTTPVSVSILSASLTSVNLATIDKKKYDQDVQAIQQGLKEAEQNAQLRAAVVQTSIPTSSNANPNIRTPYDAYDLPAAHHRPTGHVELQLPIFSSAFLADGGKPPSNESNQVIFPTSVLEQFTQNAVEFPIFIEASITYPNGERRKTHVTPGDYRNRIDAAYAPYQILNNLGLFEYTSDSSTSLSSTQLSPTLMDFDTPSSSVPTNDGPQSSSIPPSSPYPTIGEGALVTFKTVTLPKGTMATLQPQEFDWTTNIPEEQQKPVLENQLRNFQCLSLGETILIRHLNHSYSFKVVALEPADGVSLLSTDLAVDILAAVNSPLHVDLSPSLKLSSISAPDEIISSQTELVLNLQKGEAKYFCFDLINPNLAVSLEIESLQGAFLELTNAFFPQFPTFECSPASFCLLLSPGFPASIYACTRRPYPTPADHLWSSEDFSNISQRQANKLLQTGRRGILLSQDDPNFRTGRFNIGVHASLADASCVFRCKVGLKSEIAVGSEGGAGKSGSLLSSSGAAFSNEPPPNATHCDHCLRWVPKSSFALHTTQCAKRNWVCPTCHFVCPTAEKDKHISISHSRITCECGFESEGDLVALHREYECSAIYDLTYVHTADFRCLKINELHICATVAIVLLNVNSAMRGLRTPTCPLTISNLIQPPGYQGFGGQGQPGLQSQASSGSGQPSTFQKLEQKVEDFLPGHHHHPSQQQQQRY